MRNYIVVISALAILNASCKLQPDSNRNYDEFNPDRVYKLQLNPGAGSVYHYDITNETETIVEVEDKKVKSRNQVDFGVTYKISKDSADNLLYDMVYDKVKLYSKSGDIEITADAANAAHTLDPLEKMLGNLKDANIRAIISSSGQVKSINGYKELENKIMANFAHSDPATRNAVQSQWNRLVGEAVVKKNLDQLFKIFPDSLVHLKDTWKTDVRQDGEIGLNIKNIYTLKAINSDIAIIEAKGKIASDNSATNVMGFQGNVTTNLEGEQLCEFELETKTGMLIGCRISADIEGTIQVMGREIPVTIKTELKLNGQKIK